MRRLIERRGAERGAVAVAVAILTVVLMGFGGLAIDMTGSYSDRQQLQNGADAAALAIAQSCQGGACATSAGRTHTLLKADLYVMANKLDGQATGVAAVDWTHGIVTVTASSTHANWFATILGHPTTDLSASSTAKWGWVSGGDTLPLTFSLPCFQAASGGWDAATGRPMVDTTVVIALKEKTCTFPAHNEVPGGFGWLNGTDCVAKVLAGNWVASDPGLDTPASCNDFDWTTLQNRTAVVPIFDQYTGTGSNAQYRIRGLAALTITGYCFGSGAQWDLDKCPSDKRIQGKFTLYKDVVGNYSIDPSAPNFGVNTVRLID